LYQNRNTLSQNLKLSIIASLTLGLAPFVPEPHIIGKLRWILGGGEGMHLADYFDLLMHGTPWIFLIYFLIKDLNKNKNDKKSKL
jgi:hypothetical protein